MLSVGGKTVNTACVNQWFHSELSSTGMPKNVSCRMNIVYKVLFSEIYALLFHRFLHPNFLYNYSLNYSLLPTIHRTYYYKNKFKI